MSEPLFSIVIPAYNSGKFITKTLDSLTRQSLRDFEVVIVNDGSKDDTQKVISEYIASYPDLNIRLISQENKGIAGARNRGIIEARGSFVAFLDHDDIWYCEKLTSCLHAFKLYPDVDLVCHDEILRDVNNRIIRTLHYGPSVADMFRRLLFRGNCISTSATIVKKGALIEIGLFREFPEFSTTEDYDLWLRLSKEYKFYFLNEVLGEYLMRDTNASLDLERHYCNQIAVLKRNFMEYEKKTFSDLLRVNLRFCKFYLMIAKYLLFKRNPAKAGKYVFKSIFQFLTIFLDVWL